VRGIELPSHEKEKTMPGFIFTGGGIHTDPETGRKYIREIAYLVGDNSTRYEATEIIDESDPEGICHAQFRVMDKLENHIRNKQTK
jgi:hypothetical protein